HADLHRPVALLGHRAVVDRERRSSAALGRELADRVEDERLQIGDPNVRGPGRVALRRNLLVLDVEHRCLLLDTSDVTENLAPLGELVFEPALVCIERVDRRISEQAPDLAQRHSGRPQQADQPRRVQLLEPVVAVAGVAVYPRRREQAVRRVQAQRLRRHLCGFRELPDRDEVLHDVRQSGAYPWGRVKATGLRRVPNGGDVTSPTPPARTRSPLATRGPATTSPGSRRVFSTARSTSSSKSLKRGSSSSGVSTIGPSEIAKSVDLAPESPGARQSFSNV